MAPLIYIVKGEDSHYIARAIAGAFKASVVLDDGMMEDYPDWSMVLLLLIEELISQNVTTLLLTDEGALMGYQAYKKGLAIYPNWKDEKAPKWPHVLHRVEGRTQEKDRVVEKVLDRLRKDKVLSGP